MSSIQVATRSTLVAVALLLATRPAAATIDCTAGINVTSTVTLSDHYVTSSSTTPCFTIIGGQTLRMNGFSVSCTSSNCLAAVKVLNDSTATVVQDGNLIGPFQYGVDASTATLGQVTVQRMILQGNFDYGIYGGTKILENRIAIDLGACIEAIHWRPIVSADFARDNFIYCPNPIGTGITADSAVAVGLTSPHLEENFINVTADVIVTTGNVRVEDNVIIAPQNPGPLYRPFFIGAGGTVGRHLCDVISESADLTFNCTFPTPGNLLNALPAP